MSTPWDKAKEQKYAKQEKRVGKKPGARQQFNSGRKWNGLRDVLQASPVAHVLIDCKDTDDKSYRITVDDWTKLKRDANRTPPGCLPALQLDISGLRLMVIEDRHYDEIINYIRVLEGRLERAENA